MSSRRAWLLFSLLAGGCGPQVEVCDDGVDNDRDQLSDCDDLDCVIACDVGAEDSDSAPAEDCDDLSGDDEDGDGSSNCEDAECLDSPACDEVVGFVEIGRADVSDSAWQGAATVGWERYESSTLAGDGGTFRAPASTLCHVAAEQAGVVHSDAAACEGCAFAFAVTYAATSVETGDDCENWTLTVSEGGESIAYSLDGLTYGFGFNPAYTYGDFTGPALMFYVPPDDEASPPTEGSWFAASFDVDFSSDTLDYAWAWGGWEFY